MTLDANRIRPGGALLVTLMIAIASCGTPKTGTDAGGVTDIDNYAELYLRGSYDILHIVKAREMEKVGVAAKIAAQRILAGGDIRSSIWTPHIMYAGACDETVPGNPNIAPDNRWGGDGFRELDNLGAGDVLIAAHPGNNHLRERGVYVIGVGYPMATNRYSPPGFNDNPGSPMEAETDIMIYTWGPKEDGLVTPALTPHLKICPTSPMTVLGYWLLTAQIAHNIAYSDTSGSSAAAVAYLDTLMHRLSAFHRRHIAGMDGIARTMADRVLDGGKIYPYSSRWEFYQEASGTAGSLMGIYPIHPDGIYTGPGIHNPPAFDPDELTERDILILAVSGDTPEVELEATRRVKDTGALIVGILPFEREDGWDSGQIGDLCDYRLDNLSGDMWGVLDLPGYDHSVIPATALMNNYAYWTIVAAYVQEMERRNTPPYYWMSWHVPGGKAYTDSVHVHFLKRGY